jgi:myo-inositol-1(or 4)-monophosphatase
VPEPFELLALAEGLARQAGALIRDGRRSGLTDVGTKSSVTDMVTEFDRASEALIVHGLQEVRPDDTIVGEEGMGRTGSSELTWYVDPIDGTTNYLYELPVYAVSIGASDLDGPLVGVVHLPVLGETFTAVRGHGAWLGGARIHCRPHDDLSTSLIATGFSYLPGSRTAQATVISRVIGQVRDIRRLGAASADLCFVACGRFDGYFELGLASWDLAAGELIARESGARTSDFSGGPARPGQVVAATPGIHDALLALLADSDAAAPAAG